MRLDPERPLAAATVLAIQDLLESRAVPMVDDSALLGVALGVADAPTRLACARAILAYPSVRARLLSVRASVSGTLGTPTPGHGDREDLGRLSAFAAPFDEAAARAVFPTRFGEGLRLNRLAEGGWLEAADSFRGPVFRIPDRFRTVEVALESEETSRFIRYFAESVRSIDRGLAEGQWIEAMEVLRRTLPDLRAAWRFADATGDFEAVATFADTLAAELMEMGAWDSLADLAAAGYRASDALGRPGLRSRLLSYEGVAESRRGDSARAVELWSARVELNRRVGNPVAEADALLDLAGEAGETGDRLAWERWDRQAEDAVDRAGRADLTATLWTMRAKERLVADDVDGAAVYAERALEVFSGNLGLDVGLYVRIGAAETLAKSGRSERAIQVVGDLLGVSLEAGRPAHAATLLTTLAALLESDQRIVFARRCLLLALGIQQGLSSRQAAETEKRLAKLLATHSLPAEVENGPVVWRMAVEDVLAELRQGFPGVVLA